MLVGNVKQINSEEKSGLVETGLAATALYSNISYSTLSLVGNKHLRTIIVLTICFLVHCEVDNSFAIAIQKTSR